MVKTWLKHVKTWFYPNAAFSICFVDFSKRFFSCGQHDLFVLLIDLDCLYLNDADNDQQVRIHRFSGQTAKHWWKLERVWGLASRPVSVARVLFAYKTPTRTWHDKFE